MNNAIVQQLSEIQDRGEIEQVSQSNLLLRYVIFSKVLCKISGFALKIAFQQYAMVRLDATSESYNLPPCKKILVKTMGIPCAHQIKKMEQFGRKLKIIDFHRQWWLPSVPRPELCCKHS